MIHRLPSAKDVKNHPVPPLAATGLRQAFQAVALRLGLALLTTACSTGSNDRPPAEALGTQTTALTSTTTPDVLGKLCASRDVNITNVDGDLRDIWIGRETAATGKQTGLTPSVSLRFDRPLDAALLGRALTLTGQVGFDGNGPVDCRTATDGTAIDQVPLSIGYAAGTWTAGTAGTSSQRFLYDFQVFVTGNASGTPHTAGAVAAGGNVSFTNASVNTDARFPYAVIANGNVSMTTGSILGKVSYGGTVSLPGSVYVAGAKTREKLIDFTALAPRISGLGGGLAARTATAPAIVGSDKSIRCAGTRTDLNVFSVAAKDLGQATSVVLSAPAGAAMLINVQGSSATLANFGLSLSGIGADRLVWNFLDAKTLNVNSVGLSGTLLAPRAAVTFNNGSLAGQLIAASVAGNGTFNTVTFAGWDKFGAAGSDVSVTPQRALKRGCTYTLAIKGPLDQAHACMANPFAVSFVVDATGLSTLARENTILSHSKDGKRVTAFTPRSGVSTPTADVLTRYAADLGITPGETFSTNTSWKAPESTLRRRLFRQAHLGVPVEGGSFLIDEDASSGTGIVRSVTGSAVSDLPSDVTPSVTASTALATALSAVKAASPYPWTSSPSTFKAPTMTLMLVGAGATRTLAWRVDLAKSGLNTQWVDVNAKTGVVVGVAGGPQRAQCNVLNPTSSELVKKTLTNGAETLNLSYVRFGDSMGTEGNLVAPPAGSTELKQSPNAPFLTDLIGYQIKTGEKKFLGNTFTPSFNLLPNVCSRTEDFLPTLAEAQAQTYVEAFSAFVTNLHYDFTTGTTPSLWRGITGDDVGNGTVLRTAVSSSNTWGKCPLGAYVGCTPAQRVTEGAYSSYVSSPRKDPYIYLNPAYVSPRGLTNDVSPGIVAHELGHLMFGAGRDTLGLVPHPTAEGASIDESYGDIMLAAFQRHYLPNDDSYWSYPDDRISFNDPKSLLMPDTVGGDFWCSSGDVCDPHMNESIFDYWFYLMVTGVNGDGVNDAGCTYHVPQVGFVDTFRMAFFAATEGLDDTPTFEELKDATILWGSRAGNDAMRAARDAWLAVGVGTEQAPENASPAFDAHDVPVDPARITFTTTSTDPWEIQIATDQLFTKDLQTLDAAVIVDGPTRTLGVEVPLSKLVPTYYWHARPKSPKPWPANGACLDFLTFHPTQTVGLVEPSVVSDGVYQADPEGHFLFDNIPGITAYVVNFSTTEPAGCPSSYAPGPSSTMVGPHPLRDTRTSFSALTDFFPSGAPDPAATYYVTISGASDDLATKLGTACLKVPFRFRSFAAPVRVYPPANFSVPFETDQFNEYQFSIVPEAVAYRVEVIHGANMVWSQTFTPAELKTYPTSSLFPAPVFAVTVPPKIFAGTPDDVYWSVVAIAADGYERRATDANGLYRVGTGVPKIRRPLNGATNESFESLEVAWTCGNAASYRVTLALEDQTLVYDRTFPHRQDMTVQNIAIPATSLRADTQYKLTVWSTQGTSSNAADVSFKTGPKPNTLGTPTLVTDAVCDTDLPSSIWKDGATRFVVMDLPGADQFEFEFTDPDTGLVTARGNPSCDELVSNDGYFCPAIADKASWLCVFDAASITYHWTDAQEAVADQTALSFRNGFRYAYFRVRARNFTHNVTGPYSRQGVMVSCIDQDRCTFEKIGDLVVPEVPDSSGVPNPAGVRNSCDDIRLAQIDKGVLPAGSCVSWAP